MTSWSVGQMLYHQATGDLVTNPREGPGGGRLALLYFWTKLRPEGPKKFFSETASPLLCKSLDDPPPPPRLLGARN